MKDYVIWGGTGQAKVVHEALSGQGYNLSAIIDNRKITSPLTGVPILYGQTAFDEWLEQRGTLNGLLAVVAIGGGNGKDRLSLMRSLKKQGIEPISVVHHRAFIAKDATIGEGCQILAQSAVCTHAKLGDGVIINTAASVDHDCRIGAGAHIGPGAHLAGEITVGPNAFIGTGAVILPGLTIGEGATVGAGAVVTKPVADHMTMVGNPARIHKP